MKLEILRMFIAAIDDRWKTGQMPKQLVEPYNLAKVVTEPCKTCGLNVKFEWTEDEILICGTCGSPQ